MAGRIGRKATLAAGISLSIPAFVGAYALGSGDVLAFYAISLASGATLPVLSLAGYEPGTDTEEGLGALSVAYALVPCALKLFALAFLCAAATGENGRKT